MAIPADPDPLYSDTEAAAGSLGAVLRAVAVEEGLSVPFTVSEHDPVRRASVAGPVPHRTPLDITAWAVERRWSIRGCESFQDLALVDGDTQDLVQVVRAAQAWHDGAGLADIQRAAPFAHLTGRHDVSDHDPVELTESEWQHLLTEASESDWPSYLALIEASYAEPALRALYPYTSHWTLRFARTTRPRLAGDVAVCLAAAYREDRYTVSAQYMGEVLAETTTAVEAVATALRHLPPDLGPVMSGAL
ncbi:DUF6193 family natural product biosynthesis protein [Streptomyces sp. NPDC055962]|uniref:DUF6193 family natural product biosynthesis protein n=1 Tax=Streptomyces sp. NPDC055962 TaxID=3345667 RepID=UPI0035DFB72E